MITTNAYELFHEMRIAPETHVISFAPASDYFAVFKLDDGTIWPMRIAGWGTTVAGHVMAMTLDMEIGSLEFANESVNFHGLVHESAAPGTWDREWKAEFEAIWSDDDTTCSAS